MDDQPYEVRTGLALRLTSWLELNGGLVLRPYSLTRLGPQSDLWREETLQIGCRAGGTLALKAGVPLGRHFLVYAAAGTDVFATRESFVEAGGPTLETSWVAPYVGLGVSIRGWR